VCPELLRCLGQPAPTHARGRSGAVLQESPRRGDSSRAEIAVIDGDTSKPDAERLPRWLDAPEGALLVRSRDVGTRWNYPN